VWLSRAFLRREQMQPDVVFQHFGHKAIDTAADICQQHQHVSAIVSGGERTLDRIHLATDALNAGGVGFLGAGVIFKDGANVRGLNTAATIWCSAAIGALSGLGAVKLALVLAAAVLATNMVLRPLAYRIHPALPEAIPIETVYEVKLLCKTLVATHIRTLLLSTISHLPVTLQSIHGEQDDANEQAKITAVMRTVGRNNEAIEQVVMRLSIEEDVSKISWSIVEAAME
jgi:putative Mg2+ transporter-C (MgtC) family protein